jgi:hypothetical protein
LGQDGNAKRRKNDVNFVFPKRKLRRLRESKLKVSTVFEAAAMTGAVTGSRREEHRTVAKARE